MKDSDIRFFRPLWIRIAVTGVVVVWFVLETIFSHDPMWMTITGIGIVYCVWNFFLRFPKDGAGAATAPDASAPAAQDPPKRP